jgi:hypothetical protein
MIELPSLITRNSNPRVIAVATSVFNQLKSGERFDDWSKQT